MTDNEIIKALECCSKITFSCDGCPLKHLKYSECYELVIRSTLDLINRQKAEIERLKDFEQNVYEAVEELRNKIKIEAVKEFVEAYKDQIEDCTGMFTDEGFYVPLDAVLNAVDFIRERLVGEG